MPALPSSISSPIWDPFAALLPYDDATHPLGCHRPHIPDRLVFDKSVQVLVVGCAYQRIADAPVSATTLRRRRNTWIATEVIDQLRAIALAAYDRMIGLELDDGGMTTAPCGGELAGRSPVDRGTQGRKRSLAVDAAGIPLGTVAAPANHHDAPLLGPTLATLNQLGPRPDGMTVHLDHGCDADVTRERLARRCLTGGSPRRADPRRLRFSSDGPSGGPKPE